MQATQDNEDIVATRTYKANRKFIVLLAVGAITLCAGIPAPLILTPCYQPVRAQQSAQARRIFHRCSNFPPSDSISIVRAEYTRFLSLCEILQKRSTDFRVSLIDKKAWYLPKFIEERAEVVDYYTGYVRMDPAGGTGKIVLN